MGEMAWQDDSDRQSPPAPPQQPSRQALRLMFRFDENTVELTAAQPLRKLVTQLPGPSPEEGRHQGEWLQLRDSDDRVLYTRVLNDPLGTRVEVHDPDTGPYLVTGPRGRGTFDVLVPDLPTATTAVLYASPPVEGRGLRPAVAVARFDLRPGPDRSRTDRGDVS